MVNFNFDNCDNNLFIGYGDILMENVIAISFAMALIVFFAVLATTANFIGSVIAGGLAYAISIAILGNLG